MDLVQQDSSLRTKTQMISKFLRLGFDEHKEDHHFESEKENLTTGIDIDLQPAVSVKMVSYRKGTLHKKPSAPQMFPEMNILSFKSMVK